MSGQLGDLVISLSADIARFREDMGKATKIAQESATAMSKSFEGIHGAIGGIGKAFVAATAVLAGGAMFKDMINTTKTVMAEVTQLSKAFGISAQSASYLRIALDDAFLSVDQAISASDRLTRAAIKNSEAFDQVGISVYDDNEHLKNSMQVMMEVNTYLLTLKEGKDRDTAAMTLYGKSWRELSGIIKLTEEGMKEAKTRAEELHLVFDSDGPKSMKAYKMAMKDIDDVSESFKVQIGIAILPVLTQMATAFGDTGVKAVETFAKALSWSMQMLEESGALIQRYIAKVSLLSNLPSMLVSKESRAEVQAELDAIEQMYVHKIVKIDQKYGNIVKARKTEEPKGGTFDPAEAEAERQKFVNELQSAHNAYIGYEKDYEERRLAQAKNANAILTEQNKQAFEHGLVDLKTYLDKKHELNQNSLQLEIAAKQKEYELMAREVKASKAKYDADPSGDGNATKYNEALGKREKAIQAVVDAENKLTIAKLIDADETKKMTKEQLDGYKSLEIAMMDQEGLYEEATAKKIEMAMESIEYIKMETEAVNGNAEALMGTLAKFKEFQNMKKDAIGKSIDDQAKWLGQITDANIEMLKSIGLDTSLLEKEKARQTISSQILKLQNDLTTATGQQTIAIQAQINLLNKKAEMTQRDIELAERLGVLNGSITGFNNGKAVYADQYAKEQAATGYVSDAQLLAGAGRPNISTVNSNNTENKTQTNTFNISVQSASDAQIAETVRTEIANSPYVTLSDPFMGGE